MNLGWRVSNAASRRAGICSHGCSLPTQADSPTSSPVSRPATHNSWVGGVGEPGPAKHWQHGAPAMLWYCRWRLTFAGFLCGYWFSSDTPFFLSLSLSLALSCCVTEQRCSIIPLGATESWSHADDMFTRLPPPGKTLSYLLQLHQLITFWLAGPHEPPGLINLHRRHSHL